MTLSAALPLGTLPREEPAPTLPALAQTACPPRAWAPREGQSDEEKLGALSRRGDKGIAAAVFKRGDVHLLRPMPRVPAEHLPNELRDRGGAGLAGLASRGWGGGQTGGTLGGGAGGPAR